MSRESVADPAASAMPLHVAWLVHQLRNELMLARALVQMAERSIGDIPAADFLRRARHAIDRVATMVGHAQTQDTLFTSPPPLERLDLSALVASAVERMQPRFAESGVHVVVSQPPGRSPGEVMGVATLLDGALANVLSNAVEATPPGARVVLSLAEPSPGWVEVSVVDSGPGFDPATLPRLLREPVSTKGEPSRGMGLLITKDIVERIHGGRLELACAPGGGAVCRIQLPLARP